MRDTHEPPEPDDRPPLDGVRVLDIGHIVAGPMVGGILGDFGADVIKVENPRLPDPLRQLLKDDRGIGLWSKVEDRNKRPITLDLKRPEGGELFGQLIDRVDVLVDNFRPEVLARLGFSDEELAARNPRLIICHITGWGLTGPYASRSAYGRIAEATSGFANLNGEPDGPPMHSAMSLGDTVASIWSAYGIMLALRARERDGRGQVVDVGLHEPLFRQIETQVITYDQRGQALTRQGSRNPTAPTANLYRTRDGRWYSIGSATPRTLDAILQITGLAGDAEVGSVERLEANLELYHERVGAWMAEHDAEEIDRRFAEADAAGAPVLTVPEMIDHPQIRARDMVIEVPDEELGSVRMPGIVPKLQRTPGRVRHAGRPVGSATDEVLAELGLDESAIARLRGTGVV